ncbi:DUF397 domain-containing protein [Streptomyces sp. S07_1.15]|uniref:DUF397 domain-containing protein n=1 Tax=Streptomyces sp. S07_1.15 TaxID=2873925 RepID=UPI001D1373FB|nr:DUF397 domain-containing protein [Streptomyces sp. S07_1.15]MCC3655664.1 DUF397 domain-containing protein [Streptomyces sp. S07_1.15]
MVEPWTWRKSSLSDVKPDTCVEVAWTDSLVLVRDSQYPQGPVLRFRPAGWQAFIGHIAAAPAPAGSTPGRG